MKSDNLIPVLVDKMLEPHGLDYMWAVENKEVDGVYWYEALTTTKEAEAKFRAWAIPVIKKTLKCSLRSATSEYEWFNLVYGLKIEI